MLLRRLRTQPQLWLHQLRQFPGRVPVRLPPDDPGLLGEPVPDHAADRRPPQHLLLHPQHLPGQLLPHQPHPRHRGHVLRRAQWHAAGGAGSVSVDYRASNEGSQKSLHWRPKFMFTCHIWAPVQNSVLNVKVLVSAFNQEKALVGTSSVIIVKTSSMVHLQL